MNDIQDLGPSHYCHVCFGSNSEKSIEGIVIIASAVSGSLGSLYEFISEQLVNGHALRHRGCSRAHPPGLRSMCSQIRQRQHIKQPDSSCIVGNNLPGFLL